MLKSFFSIISVSLILYSCQQDRYRLELKKSSSGELRFSPEYYSDQPDIPSPCLSQNGRELVLLEVNHDRYTWHDATVENGDPFNYKRRLSGKGNQLLADGKDFPDLARTGLHTEKELRNAKTITGRSVSHITVDGRPWGSSGVGFMADNETIMSVILADNRTVKKLGLTHPDIARPLFHIWNISREFDPGSIVPDTDEQAELTALIYNGQRIMIKITGSRGWQESIFNDEILGSGHIEIWRELSQEEVDFLRTMYGNLSQDKSLQLKKMLLKIHTGEMVFFYINRYGFYEGHTEYRIDPISVALVFGLRTIEEVHDASGGDLFSYFTTNFTKNPE